MKISKILYDSLICTLHGIAIIMFLYILYIDVAVGLDLLGILGIWGIVCLLRKYLIIFTEIKIDVSMSSKAGEEINLEIKNSRLNSLNVNGGDN